jgi:hypothetical protein
MFYAESLNEFLIDLVLSRKQVSYRRMNSTEPVKRREVMEVQNNTIAL